MHNVTSDDDKENTSTTESNAGSANPDSDPDELNIDTFEDAIDESEEEDDTSNVDPYTTTLEGVGNANESTYEDVEGVGAAPQ